MHINPPILTQLLTYFVNTDIKTGYLSKRNTTPTAIFSKIQTIGETGKGQPQIIYKNKMGLSSKIHNLEN